MVTIASLNIMPFGVKSVTVSLTGAPAAAASARVLSILSTSTTVITVIVSPGYGATASVKLNQNNSGASVEVDNNARRIGLEASMLNTGPKNGSPTGGNAPSQSSVKPITRVK